MNGNESTAELPDFLNKRKFAPFENDKHWSEPFISQLIAFNYGFKGRLFNVVNYPENAYAPIEVFEKDALSFLHFKLLLCNYFNSVSSCPIIIDNSISTYCIVGCYYSTPEIFSIIIADPHVYDMHKWQDKFYYDSFNDKGENLTQNNSNFYFTNESKWMAYMIIH
jgi:hypothetical protein